MQQFIQISTRINSSSVHMYIFVCFIRNSSKYSTWCQNRGCSYISLRRRIYRSNPAVYCIFPSILIISTVELQFYYNFQGGGRQRSVQSAIGSRVFRAVLPGRIFILSGSKALQAPRVQYRFPVCSSRASKHSTRQKLHSMRPEVISSSLWCSRVAVEEEF